MAQKLGQQPLLASAALRYEIKRAIIAGSRKLEAEDRAAQHNLGTGETHEGVSTGVSSGASLDHNNPWKGSQV